MDVAKAEQEVRAAANTVLFCAENQSALAHERFVLTVAAVLVAEMAIRRGGSGDQRSDSLNEVIALVSAAARASVTS